MKYMIWGTGRSGIGVIIILFSYSVAAASTTITISGAVEIYDPRKLHAPRVMSTFGLLVRIMAGKTQLWFEIPGSQSQRTY